METEDSPVFLAGFETAKLLVNAMPDDSIVLTANDAPAERLPADMSDKLLKHGDRVEYGKTYLLPCLPQAGHWTVRADGVVEARLLLPLPRELTD